MKKIFKNAIDTAFAAIEVAPNEEQILVAKKFEENLEAGMPEVQAFEDAICIFTESEFVKEADINTEELLEKGVQAFSNYVKRDCFIPALDAAFNTITDNEGVKEFAKKKFFVELEKGEDVNEALAATLDIFCEDQEAWEEAERIFHDTHDKLSADVDDENPDEDKEDVAKKRAAKWLLGTIVVIATIAIITAAYLILTSLFSPKPVVEQEVQPPAIVEVDRTVVLEKATLALYKAGWKPGEFVLDDAIDPSKDKSTGGEASFKADGVKNAEEMVTFLGSGSEAANAVISTFANADTGATKEDVLNPNNWVTVQSLKKFSYPANSLFRNGTVAAAGTRKGSVNDIFLLFVSPNPNAKTPVKSARGGCVNPQSEIPVPKLEPKSSNPADYKYPEGKPKVPVVTTEPEKTPPVVKTEVKGPSGVVDKPTNKPGSETGVVAPEATPPVQDRANTVQDPEKKVNPGSDNNGTNTTDPGMPNGF